MHRDGRDQTREHAAVLTFDEGDLAQALLPRAVAGEALEPGEEPGEAAGAKEGAAPLEAVGAAVEGGAVVALEGGAELVEVRAVAELLDQPAEEVRARLQAEAAQ